MQFLRHFEVKKNMNFKGAFPQETFLVKDLS